MATTPASTKFESADEVEAFIASLNLTSGIRFRPTDEELIGQFLFRRIRDGRDEEDDRIKEVDIYAREPWLIWEEYSEENSKEDLYFYTELKRAGKKSSSSKKISRRIAGGKATWHGENASLQIIMNHHYTNPEGVTSSSIVNFEKRTFTYSNRGNPEDGRWIMYEYRCVDRNMVSDLVISRIKNNSDRVDARRNRDNYMVSSSSSPLSVLLPCSVSSSSDDDDREPKRQKIDSDPLEMLVLEAVGCGNESDDQQLALTTNTDLSNQQQNDDDDAAFWDGLDDLVCPDYLIIPTTTDQRSQQLPIC
ncbi:NAC domain-containing protein 68 [Linum perenne]